MFIIKGGSLEWHTQEGLGSPVTAACILERLRNQEPKAWRIMECCCRVLALNSSTPSQTQPEVRATLTAASGHSNTKDKTVLWAAAGKGLGCGSVAEHSPGTHRALGCIPSNTHARVHTKNPKQEESGIISDHKKDIGCAQAAALHTEGTQPSPEIGKHAEYYRALLSPQHSEGRGRRSRPSSTLLH